MKLQDLTARERQIYHMGYVKGKSDGRLASNYLLVGYVILFSLVISLLVEK